MAELSLFGRAARAYAARFRWAVFPLAAKSKIPAIKGGRGCLDATQDLDTITAWWTQHPDANVGVAMGAISGVFAVDIDPRNGGEMTGEDFEAQGCSFPATVEALTGGGGRHLLFTYLPEFDSIRWAPLGPGLDVKGTGGYIAVAPSVHPSGQVYAWESSSRPGDVDVATPPPWLVARLMRGRRFGTAKVPSAVDATTFVLGRLFLSAGYLGPEVRPGLWAVQCPSASLHTCGEMYDSSTVLFAPPAGKTVGCFYCAHEHCRALYRGYDTVMHVLERVAGVRVSEACAREVGAEG